MDGAIVDLANVTVVRGLLNETRFATLYEPAANGANPFSDPLPACWVLTIRTRDVPEAGTNAAIIITLTGALGQVSTVVQSSYEGMMERAGMNHATIEGADIGQIQSITLALAGGGLWSGWLPEQITVERCGLASVQFSFGVDDWVYVDKPLTKLLM
ncbi:MAG: PLAT/LH2 domain-containing protein [Acidobacteriota bacterium]